MGPFVKQDFRVSGFGLLRFRIFAILPRALQQGCFGKGLERLKGFNSSLTRQDLRFVFLSLSFRVQGNGLNH